MYFNGLPRDTMIIAKRKFSQKTTLKDQFEVVWELTAPYVDINRDKINNKTVGQSMIWREIGNKEYTTAQNKDYLRKSIEAYTKSIAFAPVGSSELSLAYANRSAVLFRARLYEDCLLDIERALKAGYPDKLKTKLFLRQSLCFKALKPSSDIEPGMSMASAMQWLPDLKKYNPTYDINKEYPKMIKELKEPREIVRYSPEIKNDNAIIVGGSDAIELKQTEENDQHIVATRDIKSGEFIYISEPFAVTINSNMLFTNCWHCARQTWAGIPCDNCPNIVYCSDLCKKKAWNSYHNIECLILGSLLKCDDIETETLMAVKMILKTLNSAGDLKKLKKIIDNIDSDKNKEFVITKCILDLNSIDNINRLGYLLKPSNDCSFQLTLHAVWIVYVFSQKTNIFGQKMTMKNLIKNKKTLILGELISRYLMMAYRNGQLFVDISLGSDLAASSVMMPICKIFKKSCDSNIDWIYLGSNIGFYASKPIKQGEPISMSTFGQYHSVSKAKRYMAFESSTDDPVPCKCIACIENWPTLDYLPSYESMVLPASIKKELISMTRKAGGLRDRIYYHADTRELLTMKDTLNSMNDKYHQYITVPCQEVSILNIVMKTLYCRLHTVYDIVQ
ncbi:SET and MYND domain-containing protein 4-like [Aphidius gifuensis]|uniref:SET and MYND domain-containing protein 4-like n=1 Tax=Aphidius gifuensis TaxID=684658 RepID=UPI001CDD19DD|nr:SET and MYND domain-containing protein 4-like [Aphidius gifuensis]